MFLQLAALSPEHYLVLDARRPVEELAAEVQARLRPLLEQAVRRPAPVAEPVEGADA
jgi:dTMP kinase